MAVKPDSSREGLLGKMSHRKISVGCEKEAKGDPGQEGRRGGEEEFGFGHVEILCRNAHKTTG